MNKTENKAYFREFIPHIIALLLVVPFALAAPSYTFIDTWDGEASEANSIDYVFFIGISGQAFVGGSNDCECHAFVDDSSAIFSVNGELTESMEEGHIYELSDGLELELVEVRLGSNNDADFKLDGESIPDPQGVGAANTETYTVDGKDYEVTVLAVDDPVFEQCTCDSESDRSACVSDAGSSDVLYDICNGGFDTGTLKRCKEGTHADVRAGMARMLDDSYGRYYRNCGGSFSSGNSDFEDGDVIEERRIQCGGTGQEDKITYKGSTGFDGEITYGDTNDECPTNYWCDQTAADNNKISNANDEFDIDPTDEISSNDICRKKAGESCTATIECLTGTLCSGGYCGGAGGNTTDLEIIDVIPIQVVPGVDMVKDKSGFVRVAVRNNGALAANGSVVVAFSGTELNASSGFGGSSKMINGNQTVNFTFDFKPGVLGSNLEIKANVSIV